MVVKSDFPVQKSVLIRNRDDKLGPTGLRSPCVTSERGPLQSAVKKRTTTRTKVIRKQQTALKQTRTKIKGQLSKHKEQASKKICEALSEASSVSPLDSPTPGVAQSIDHTSAHPGRFGLYTMRCTDNKTKVDSLDGSVSQKGNLTNATAIAALVRDFNASLRDPDLQCAKPKDKDDRDDVRIDKTVMKAANERSLAKNLENDVAVMKDFRGTLHAKGLLPPASNVILSSEKRPTSTKLTIATPSIDSDDSESQVDRTRKDLFKDLLPAHQVHSNLSLQSRVTDTL